MDIGPVHVPIQMLVIGILFVLASLLALGQKLAIKRGAKAISRIVHDSIQEHHEFQQADPADFHWLDACFYDGAQRDLESVGMHFLANVEDRTLSAVHPDKRTYVRLMLRPDGSVRAAIYEIVVGGPQGKRKASVRTTELLTEISDGGCVSTTTAPANRLFNPPPGTSRQNVPAETPAKDLLDAHWSLVERHLREHQRTSIRPVLNYEDAVRAWQRGIDRLRGKLERQGGISKDELLRIARPDQKELAAKVFEEMEKQKPRQEEPPSSRGV